MSYCGVREIGKGFGNGRILRAAPATASSSAADVEVAGVKPRLKSGLALIPTKLAKN